MRKLAHLGFRIKSKLRKLYYKLFGSLLFDLKARKRTKTHNKIKREPYKLEVVFRKLESRLQDIEYPNNDFNKIMSMVLSDIELFRHITQRFRRDRKILGFISHDDQFLHFLGPDRRSYPSHPYERENNEAVKIDVQSLFVFGTIMINRSLLLLKMYFSDQEKDSNGKSMYSKIWSFYDVLSKSTKLSNLAQKFRGTFAVNIKWLSSSLRFYRNEFIEHLDKGYQQGMNFGFYQDDFALSSYKWNYDDTDNQKVEELRNKLEKLSIKIPGRSDGGRNMINRYYVQKLFDNITLVPNDLLKEALDLIEEVGVHSPQPEKTIAEIENYTEGLLNFMSEELDSSELIKYKKGAIPAVL